MTAAELLIYLDKVDAQLSCGIDTLLAMEFSEQTWPEPFFAAAELLSDIDLTTELVAQHPALEEKIKLLRDRATTASKLLESAANIYFGRVLSATLADGGYQSDGATENVGGHCLQIDG
jgi:hypothetical protein